MSTEQAQQPTVLYRQRTGPWGWRVCWVLLALLAGYGLLSSLDRGVPFALLSAALYPLTIGLPVLIALLTLWSIDRYNAITLTATELRVGRHRVPTSDLELPDLLQAASEHPELATRWADLLAQTPPPPEPAVGRVPMLGGSFGSTMGYVPVTVQLAGLGRRRVDAARPAELIGALLQARSGRAPSDG